MESWIPVIVQAIIATTTIVGGLLILRKTQADAHKTNAEADAIEKDSDVSAAERVIELLKNEVERQAQRIDFLEKELGATKETLEKLKLAYDEAVAQLEQLRIVNAEFIEQNKKLREQVKACAVCTKVFGDLGET